MVLRHEHLSAHHPIPIPFDFPQPPEQRPICPRCLTRLGPGHDGDDVFCSPCQRAIAEDDFRRVEAEETAKDYVTAAAELLMPTYVSGAYVDLGERLGLTVYDVQAVIRMLRRLWGWEIIGRRGGRASKGGYRLKGWKQPHRIPRAKARAAHLR